MGGLPDACVGGQGEGEPLLLLLLLLLLLFPNTSLILLASVLLLHLSSSSAPPSGETTSSAPPSGHTASRRPPTGTDAEEDALFGDMAPEQLADILVKALRDKNKAGGDKEDKEDEEVEELSELKKRQEPELDEEDVSLETPTRAEEETEELRLQTQQEEEEEEQLTAEELHSLETMMKEFARVRTLVKRDSNSFNEVLPRNKNQEQRRKWQEETQKAWNFPFFNTVDVTNHQEALEDTGPSEETEKETLSPAEEEVLSPEEEEALSPEEEEALSPEEEEARAKAEQDEMRRQAAEAQRARLEEEKLADIASDMLLRYMGKERTGPKYRPLSDAPEDKRSDEQTQDLDPQTIEQLIEISSKLHLPAEDVVDIISDVEKKKRKDTPPNTPPRYFSDPGTSDQYQGKLRGWFQPKTQDPRTQDLRTQDLRTQDPRTQDLRTQDLRTQDLWTQDPWSKPRKLQPGGWSPQSPDDWLKPVPYPVPYYHRYPPAYYPLPLAPPPRPLPWYYNPYAYNRFLTNPVGSYAPGSRTSNLGPGWRLLQRPAPYYTNRGRYLNPWSFKIKAPPNRPPSRQQQWLASAASPLGKEANAKKTSMTLSRREGLERFLQQLLRNKPPVLD
uniref:VGF nerve growth factor inducible n=1 Tax=Knipowitschia caucasica TaxID=637954 RepID=A0AAV2KST9_KNICA